MATNEHLAPLAPLIGTWDTVGTHPMLPGRTMHGRWTIDWIEDGAFLRVRSEMHDAPEVPAGVFLFGADDDLAGDGTLIYHDTRGVSRVYQWSLAGNVLTWTRPSPTFPQSMTLTPAPDGRTMVAEGRMSRDGGATWEDDLRLTYTRAG